MKFIKSIGANTIKFLKGLFAIAILWFLPALGIFIFDSCKKANYENSKSGEAGRKFNNAVDAIRGTLGSMPLDNNNAFLSRTESTDNYYLEFPATTDPLVVSNFSSNITIQTLTNVMTNYGVSIDDSININANFTIQVAEEPIRVALQPLVVEAKNYLYSKGITNQQISDMLLEENAEEIDLIPFVKALTAIEQGQYTVRKLSLPLISNANALPAFLECGLAALGGDAFYALSLSNASTWTWAAMKTAFKAVAKRFLGPIGVAVAVITFGVCMIGHI